MCDYAKGLCPGSSGHNRDRPTIAAGQRPIVNCDDESELSRARNAVGLSISEAAEAVGICVETLAVFEAGLDLPEMPVLDALGAAYGTDGRWLAIAMLREHTLSLGHTT